MENQDIFNQFKKAADNAESPDFASMEKVWNRVEEKLDQKVLKKETVLWKKWAVAASVLLGLSIGYQFLKDDQPVIEGNKIVIQDDSVQKTPIAKDAVVSSEMVNPAIKKESDKILEKQLSVQNQVAWADVSVEGDSNLTMATEAIKGNSDSIALNIKSGYSVTKTDANGLYFISEKAEAKSAKSKDVEMFIDKKEQVSETKKEEALIVYDDLVKNKQGLKSVDAEEVESIVHLKEPLYIINGIYYTEQELFGPNPTSPYSPLKEQTIETISILQDEKAVEKYGEKGKKGVVIITTKDGKPAARKTR